jgi:hypothetical protein
MTTKELKEITLVEIEKSWINFYLPFKITKSEAMEVQGHLSYHPLGYGFYSFETSDDGTLWKCSRSSD